MMFPVDERMIELNEITDPWMRFDLKTEKFYLDPDAPEEIKKAKEEADRLYKKALDAFPLKHLMD